ncbi:MAG TPA: hypothetical protein VES20_03045, partial [Bryobacteraceae bacterium]|nr:hypothetical protein [Bryobacteraceae bacterium]
MSRILPESGLTEERPEKRPTILRSGFSTLVRHEALLWASPFRSPRTTFRILAPLAAATGTAIALDRRLASALPNTADQVRYSKGVSVAGSWHTLAAASGAFVGVGAIMRDRKAIETGLIAAEAIAHTESIAQMLKYATG